MELLSVCVLLLLANSCLAAEDCAYGDEKCECTASAGTTDELKLNIRDYFYYPVEVKQDGTDYIYTYNPCSKFVCEEGQGSRSRMCQSGDGVVNNCGSNIKSWVINNRNPMEFTITYDGGTDGRVTIVDFTYKDENNKIAVTSSQSKTYNFVVTGRSVAPYSPSPSKGGGGGGEDIAVTVGLALISLIIPIAIIAVVAYFVIGGLIKYYHYGARGVEIIPNYTFWKDLKNGVLVATTCTSCYKTERGDYQAVQSDT